MKYHIGITQWHHPEWYSFRSSKDSLKTYAQHFDTVEGNNTFYGLPKIEAIKQWHQAVPEHFRFCFKFPKTISHDAQLRYCSNEVSEFLKRLEPLGDKLGVVWLQLSNQFSAQQYPDLKQFLDSLPTDFTYGVEVRHFDYFDKDDNERRLNQLIAQHQINRVMFDTRTLFANPKDDDATQDALNKKPRVPLHVVATAEQPMVRFISPIDTSLAEQALQQWSKKLLEWMQQGKTPYIFFHTPSNLQAPQLAERFSQIMAKQSPNIQTISLWQQRTVQTNLF